MGTLVVGVLLAAAVAHASWNVLAKAIPDRLVASALIGLTYLVGGGVGALLLPAPAVAAWPYLAVSAVLQTVYLLVLTAAYQHGEFGRVYPLARGTSPLVVTVVTVTVLAQRPAPGQLAGIALVIGGLGCLVFAGGRARTDEAAGRPTTDRRGLALALLTGLVIACYTLVDGLGVRHSGAPLGYAAWLFLLQGPLLPTVCRLLHGRGFGAALTRYARRGVLGGVLSLASYGAVVWAQSVGNLALVAALRETSVLFAGMLGALFFGERFGRVRMAVTVLVVLGIVLMETT